VYFIEIPEPLCYHGRNKQLSKGYSFLHFKFRDFTRDPADILEIKLKVEDRHGLGFSYFNIRVLNLALALPEPVELPVVLLILPGL